MVHLKRTREDREKEDRLAKKLFGDKAGFPDSSVSSDDDGNEIYLETEKEVRKTPVWRDEDDEVEEPVVDVPLHRRKMHIRKSTDAKDQKITPKVLNSCIQLEYEQRLKKYFSRNSGLGPAWAQTSTGLFYKTYLKFPISVSSLFHFRDFILVKMKMQDTESDEDEVESILQEMTAVTRRCITKSSLLPKGVINVKRLNNITLGHRFGKQPIRILKFHPNRKLLMCGGENGLLGLFEIDLPETKESFLQSIRLKSFPITSAAFSTDGLKIVIGSRKKESLFCYDLLDGKLLQMRTPYVQVRMSYRNKVSEMTKSNAGYFSLSSDGKLIAVLARNEVHILTSMSSEYIGVLTAPTRIVSVQFSPNDSSAVYAFGENGQVFIWSIKMLKDQQTFYDEGCVKGTVIRIRIVNLYNMSDALMNSFPKPLKVFDNLTTSVDSLEFNFDSQILSLSSSVKNNAIRLAHVGSRTVYTNFPPRGIKVGKVTVTDFSPRSAFMAVGDDKGFVSLFRLSHFSTY
ncbi:unnamed protein product [Thelazia callipaeda]|uniref:WD_REPEATS_REGION domain-containing protein n=1 Tax=Thelazia callipaeda TaxID=103827 RepID=A0A158RBN0_THECL|nr:unnamed protein product [Thelazia callipaeda]